MDNRVNHIRSLKERQSFSAFASLIENPAVGSVRLPARCRGRFVATVPVDTGLPLASVTGTTKRTFHAPGAMVAGDSIRIDNFERGYIVKPRYGFEFQVDIGLGVYAPVVLAGNTPDLLFTQGQDGAILDPSDLSTLWSDEARTAHPELPGDPVWWIDDVSPNANHFGVVNSAARGRLYKWPASAVLENYPRNFLRHTEDLSSWVNAGQEVSVAAGAADPDGGNTAFTLTGLSGSCRLTDIAGELTPGTTATFSLWARSVSGTPSIRLYTGGNVSGLIPITTEWAIYQYTTTVGETSLGTAQIRMGVGDVVEVWKPQNEHGDVRTPYQRVGSGIWDVTEEGQADCWGVGFDGVSTNYVSTRGIPNYSGNKFRLLIGQTKNSYVASYPYIVSTVPGSLAEGDWFLSDAFNNTNRYAGGVRNDSVTNVCTDMSINIEPPHSAILDYGVGGIYRQSLKVNNLPTVINNAGAAITLSNSSIRLSGRSGIPYNGIIWGTILVGEEPDETKWEETARQWLSSKMGGILE